jgi:hypothetical protein
MSKEAMKLALEALTAIDVAMPFPVGKSAIKALEEALKQEQEPVFTYEQVKAHIQVAMMSNISPQRTWVGLTWNDVPDEWVGKVAFMEGAKWADKQLKEKNA